MTYFIEVPGGVREVSMLEWARFYEDRRDERRVDRTIVGAVEVSTVFLGIDHNFHGEGPPILYETMTFPVGGERLEEGCWRYSTREEAAAGHARVVKALQEGRDPNADGAS